MGSWEVTLYVFGTVYINLLNSRLKLPFLKPVAFPVHETNPSDQPSRLVMGHVPSERSQAWFSLATTVDSADWEVRY